MYVMCYTPARNTSSCNAHNRLHVRACIRTYACTYIHTDRHVWVCVSLCLFVIEAKVAATADIASLLLLLLSAHFTWQTDKICDAHSNAQKVFLILAAVIIVVVVVNGSYLSCHSTPFDSITCAYLLSLQLLYTLCINFRFGCWR